MSIGPRMVMHWCPELLYTVCGARFKCWPSLSIIALNCELLSHTVSPWSSEPYTTVTAFLMGIHAYARGNTRDDGHNAHSEAAIARCVSNTRVDDAIITDTSTMKQEKQNTSATEQSITKHRSDLCNDAPAVVVNDSEQRKVQRVDVRLQYLKGGMKTQYRAMLT